MTAGLSGVQREAIAASVQAAQAAVEESMPSTRAGVVLSVDPTNTVALVQADGPNGGPFGADVVAPVTLFPGDRVMLQFAPPHGCMVIGRRSGDMDDWHVVGDPGEPDYNGGKGVLWDHAVGTTLPGQQTAPSALCFTRRSGVVHLMGRAGRVTGTNNNVFALPEGYRPPNDLLVSARASLGAHEPLTIDASTGMLTVSGTGIVLLVVDGISFPAHVTNPAE